MTERTEQTRNSEPLDQRVRDTLDAIDTAFTDLSADADEQAAAELEAIEIRSVPAGTTDAADPEAATPGEYAPPADGDIEELLGEDIEAVLAAAGDVADVIAREAADVPDRGSAPAPPIEQAERTVAGDAPAEGSPATPVDAEMGTEETLESVLADAIGASEPEPTGGPVSIEQIDNELAGLAESIVEGDFEDSAGEVDPVEIPEVMRVEMEPSTRTSHQENAAAAEDAAPTEEPGATPEPQTDTEAPVAGTPEGDTADTGPESDPRRGVLPRLISGVLVLISKPAAGLSASARDTVGWLGLYTGFLAVCVWGFVLFFRKPTIPKPIAQSTRHTEGHAPAAGSHAKESHAPPAHSKAKKSHAPVAHGH